MRGNFVQPLVQLPLVGRGRLRLKGKQTATSLVPRPCCPRPEGPSGTPKRRIPPGTTETFLRSKSRPNLWQPLGTGPESQDRAHAFQAGMFLVSEWGLELRRRRASVIHHFQGWFTTDYCHWLYWETLPSLQIGKQCNGDRKGGKQGKGTAEARGG